MTDRASLADAIEYAIVGACNCAHIGNKSPEPDAHYETCRYRVLRLASDALRTPPPDHAALVQSLLATCDRLGMTNVPAGAPAAFARVLGELGAMPDEDWIAVPRKPTHAMCKAAHDGPLMAGDEVFLPKDENWIAEMYAAMLAAAPAR